MPLVSPGTQVTLTDESFFIPAGAGSVPLFFIATADEKFQPDGLTPAAGTYENSNLRTITTIEQALELYGVPRFLTDLNDNALHGDARNEYGLQALINYLGIANKAYVIRVNVNLNDDLDDLRDMWQTKMGIAGSILENLTVAFIEEFNITNGYIPGDPNYKETVAQSELISLAQEASTEVFSKYSFNTLSSEFFVDYLSTPIDVFGNGFDQAPTDQYFGFNGSAIDWVATTLGTVVNTEWTPNEAYTMFLNVSDAFQFTAIFRNGTTLGANDAAKRNEIVTAFQAEINLNQDARSENLEYNIVACPGYYESIDELVLLVQSLKEEIFIVGDTPMNLSPEDTVDWADNNSIRVKSDKVAYYYPSGIMSNLTGIEVLVPASSIVVRTIAYNDLVGEFWTSPAGIRRGLINGVSAIGYVTGTLGTATTFVESNLSEGQRDDLYKDFTNINPITRLPGRGLLVNGQKVSASATSSLDRVNVQRLIMYIRRQIRKNTLPFLFEPNDQKTRDNLKASIDSFLGDIVVKRGLFDFVTKSDESNNSPSAVDRHEITIEILLKPTIDVEFIYVPIRVLSTGSSF